MKNANFIRRKNRVSAKITAFVKRPLLTVFRSNKHIYAQIIAEDKKTTLASANDLSVKQAKKNKTEIAKEVGKLIGQRAQEKQISVVTFMRSGYKYHGRVKALAEGSRNAGLKF